ncbi:Rtr1/RPAP2 family-domain-containing protein [Dipodascopsis uninucleata]
MSSSLDKFNDTILKKFTRSVYLTPREANNLVLLLTEFMSEAVDAIFLRFAARFLTPEYYDDVVAERNVSHICGYPTCDTSPTVKIMGRIEKRISYDGKNAYMKAPSSYLNQYCSKRHFQASAVYRAQLSDEAIWSRLNVCTLPFGETKWDKISLLEDILEDKERNEEDHIRKIITSVTDWSLESPQPNEIAVSTIDRKEPNNQGSTKGTSSGSTGRADEITGIAQKSIKIKIVEREKAPQLKEYIAFTENNTIEGYQAGSSRIIQPPQAYFKRKSLRDEKRREQE